MALLAAVGHAHALDGREAGLQATHQALNSLEASSSTFGIVIVPYRYDPQQVISGVASLLGNTPIIGFSTTASLSKDGQHPQSVVVALLSSDDLQAEAHWFPSYAQSSQDISTRMMQLLDYQQRPAKSILVFADGFNGDAEQLCNAIPSHLPVVGGLASGELHTGTSFQIAGSQSGMSGLSAAFLRGEIKVGIGVGHGWQPVGPRTRVTRSRGYWLRTLDGRPATETYAKLFGYPTRDWAFAPLNHLTRLYPLGLDQGSGTADLLIRAPLRVEADGSLRMNVQMRDGSDAYVLVGIPTACKEAAEKAAQQAINALGDAKPVFALVLVDVAWQMLMQPQPGEEIAAVQKVFGKDFPLAGGYTLGQITPGSELTPPKFLNQQMLVVAFGATGE